MTIDTADQLDTLDFEKLAGLVPVTVQHAATGETLMLAFANRAALERTLAERRLWFWSRRRRALWCKGETSGHFLDLVSLHADCDCDAILALARPHGPTCHTGARSCFGATPTLAALAATIENRRTAASGTGHGPVDTSYTRLLLRDENLRLKKLGEEALELALAARDGDSRRVAEEAADLFYHTLVACAAVGVSAEDVLTVLDERLR